ncbi:hypothetical protein Tco_1048369, partial [Tanacetum coccineum]
AAFPRKNPGIRVAFSMIMGVFALNFRRRFPLKNPGIRAAFPCKNPGIRAAFPRKNPLYAEMQL